MKAPGVLHLTDLRHAGWSDREIAGWVRSGAVRTVGRFRVTAEASPRIVALLELGLRPTCADAGVLAGLWTPPYAGLHGYAPRRGPRTGAVMAARADSGAARRVPAAAGRPGPGGTSTVPDSSVVLHAPVLSAWPDSDAVADIPLLLEHAARCLGVRRAATMFESALHQGRITRVGVEDVLARLPGHLGRDLARVNGLAESGTETLVRWWFESTGVPVSPQVWIPGVGRVDMLVGRGWVVECDSRRFHGTEEAFHRDRYRDLHLRAMGFTVTRLTWEQVMLSWEETEESLRAVIRRRDHRRSPARGV